MATRKPTRKPTRKHQINYNKVMSYGKDAELAANAILTHRNPEKRLAGLVKLLDRGEDIRFIPSEETSDETILVNGVSICWVQLEMIS